MTHTRCMLCAFLITFLLLSLWLPTSANDEGAILDTQKRTHLSHQFQLIEKKLLEDRDFSLHHNRKLGSKKKKKKGEKSSAIRSSGMSISHASLIFCTSLLLCLVLIQVQMIKVLNCGRGFNFGDSKNFDIVRNCDSNMVLETLKTLMLRPQLRLQTAIYNPTHVVIHILLSKMIFQTLKP